jgi:hypothetical protein
MANIKLLHAIAHDLEHHANSARIRKLIFYICKRSWENDLETLKSHDLGTLIQELIQLYPQLPELDCQLNNVARSLSKPAEYSLTANLILQKVRRLYSEVQPEPSLEVKQQPISQITQSLSQDPNSIRIKKLLVYICRNTWENDSDRLNQYDLQELIEELLQIAPTLESLSLVLNSVIRTLNRQAEYKLVANTITSQLSNLYPEKSRSTQLLTNDCSTQIVVQTELTHLTTEPQQSKVSGLIDSNSHKQIASILESHSDKARIKKLVFFACRNHWENNLDNLNRVSLEVLIQELQTIAPAIADLKLLFSNIVNTLNRKAEYLLVADTIIQTLEASYYSPHPVEIASPLGNQSQANFNQPTSHHPFLELKPQTETETVVEIENVYDSFELRLEIMKYTNPLRAKILLFSVLKHKFSFTTADWSALKCFAFDDLLQQIIEQCDTLSILESRLEIIASCLEDSFAYNQAAGAIIQCLKPFYPLIQRQQQLSLATPISSIDSKYFSSEQTQIKLNTEETLLTSGHGNTKVEIEQTCQFFSAVKPAVKDSPRSPNDLAQTCKLPPP